jgi:ATP-dependent Clp protease ATP-binding subunit ClpB
LNQTPNPPLQKKQRRRPYCVVLLDEVEKAHADVFQVFLQVLDDGRATDAQGRTVSFKNAVIIMTSNLGSADVYRSLGGPARAGVAALNGGSKKPALPSPTTAQKRAVVAAKGGAVVASKRAPAPSANGPTAPPSDDALEDQKLVVNGNGTNGNGTNGTSSFLLEDEDDGDANCSANGSSDGGGGDNSPEARALYADVKQRVMEAVRGHFRPEFVNRVDDFIVFHPLAAEEIRAIVGMRAAALVARLKAQQRIELRLSSSAVDALARVGYDPVFGARPVKRALQRELQTPMALALLRGDFREGDKVVAEAADEPLVAVEGKSGGEGDADTPSLVVIGDGSGSRVPTGSVGTALRLRLEYRPPAAGQRGAQRVAELRSKFEEKRKKAEAEAEAAAGAGGKRQ